MSSNPNDRVLMNHCKLFKRRLKLAVNFESLLLLVTENYATID